MASELEQNREGGEDGQRELDLIKEKGERNERLDSDDKLVPR